jgi:hypothetical protein
MENQLLAIRGRLNAVIAVTSFGEGRRPANQVGRRPHRDTKFMGYGIRRRRAQKPRALPSAKTSRSKSVFPPPESNLTDAIHFRVPENWRGKIKSKRVRKWFTEFLGGRHALALTDPGAGGLEVSVRISRRELNEAAKRFGISGAVLLRRLIAAQLGVPISDSRAMPLAPRVPANPVSAPDPLIAWLKKLIVPALLPAEQRPICVPEVPKPERRLNMITQVPGVRSLQEIDRAKSRGDGITFEELMRWRAVFDRK